MSYAMLPLNNFLMTSTVIWIASQFWHTLRIDVSREQIRTARHAWGVVFATILALALTAATPFSLWGSRRPPPELIAPLPWVAHSRFKG